MTDTSKSGSFSLKSLLLWGLFIDVVLSFLTATSSSILLYSGAEIIGASKPATWIAAVSGWFLSFGSMLVVQGFIMLIGFIIFAVLVGLFSKKATERSGDKGDQALNSLFKWGVRIDLVVSLLATIYNGAVLYGLMSAAGADPTLNLIATIMQSIVTFVYFFLALGFIGTIATVILGVLFFVFTGGMNKKGTTSGDATGK